MGFFTRIGNGWELVKVSLDTINKNKSLLLFPVFSVFSLVLILGTFLGGTFFFFGDSLEQLFNDEESGQIAGYAVVFVYYFINFFIVVFFNSALIFCAVKILNGEETTLGEGISFAMSKIGKIVAWAAVASTVGTLLQVLQNNGKIGKFVASLFGLAWSLLTFFVVPVLIFEDKGVIDTIKQSGRMMRDKWGESLAGNVSFGIFHFLGIVVGILVGIALAGAVNPILGIVVGICIVILVSTVISAAQTIFVAAVYNRVNGKPVGNFSYGTLDEAFIRK